MLEDIKENCRKSECGKFLILNLTFSKKSVTDKQIHRGAPLLKSVKILQGLLFEYTIYIHSKKFYEFVL